MPDHPHRKDPVRQIAYFTPDVRAAALAHARQVDADGSKDHPLVPRMAGFNISSYDAKDFNGYTFLLAGDKEERVEGRFWEIEYWIKDGAKTPSGRRARVSDHHRTHRRRAPDRCGLWRLTPCRSQHHRRGPGLEPARGDRQKIAAAVGVIPRGGLPLDPRAWHATPEAGSPPTRPQTAARRRVLWT